MTLRIKASIANQARDLTLVKTLCFRVFKKSWIHKLGSSKHNISGTGVRYQVITGFPKFDDVVIVEPKQVHDRMLAEQFRGAVDAARNLLKIDRLRQELAMQQVCICHRSVVT